MTTVAVGDRVNVRYLAFADGEPTTATMSLVVTNPAGETVSADITPTDPNIYDASFLVDAAGYWQWVWVASGAIDDVQVGSLLAEDPGRPTYASLAELKRQLRITDTDDDDELAGKLRTATERIKDDCGGRVFWRDTVPSARIFPITNHDLVMIDDIADPTGLVVEIGNDPAFSLVAPTAYRLKPENCFALNRGAYAIERKHWTVWPWGHEMRVTALWGWPVIPTPIHDACLLYASRIYRRKDSPEGVAGLDAQGVVVRVGRYDSDYEQLISNYVKPVN